MSGYYLHTLHKCLQAIICDIKVVTRYRVEHIHATQHCIYCVEHSQLRYYNLELCTPFVKASSLFNM